MAQNTSLPQLSGRLGNLLFTVRDGKNHVQMARDYSDRHRQRMKNPRMDTYRLNIHEFAAASSIASEIYRGLWLGDHGRDTTPGPIYRAYPHNHLTAKIRAAGDHRNKERTRRRGKGTWFATSFTISDIAQGVKGLDLSKETAPAAAVRIQALGPAHNPTELRITGLPQAAAAIRTANDTLLECRIHLVQAQVTERHFDPDTNRWIENENLDERGQPIMNENSCPPSDWIPAHIIPAEGLKIPIPELHENSKHVTAILIEWRAHRDKGRRLVRLHDKGIVRIAAVHAPATAWQDTNETAKQPQSHHILPTPRTLNAPKKPDWRKSPKEYIQQAINKMRHPDPIPRE